MAEELKDLSFSTKKKFRIDGDQNRVIEIDPSDMNILVRLEDTYPKIKQLAISASEKMSTISEDDSLTDVAEVLRGIDTEMRKYMDYIFDADVSAKCAPSGNMFDPTNGQFRFEHIIEVLTQLYANNITSEFKKMQDNVKKHTTKYVGNSKRNKKNV